VREVLIRRRITRVPDAAFPVLGLLSLRGEVVTVFDLAGLQATVDQLAAEEEGMETTGVTTGAIRPSRVEAVVVLRGGRDSIGLVVDGVEDIRDFSASAREAEGEAAREAGPAGGGGAPAPPAPVTGPLSLAPDPGRLWAGSVEDERGALGVLDVDAAFECAMEVAERPSAGGGPVVSLEIEGEGNPAEKGGAGRGTAQNGAPRPADPGTPGSPGGEEGVPR